MASVGAPLANRARDARRAFRLVLDRPGLGRTELAYGATSAAEWAFTIGLGIVAFEDGGAGRVGAVGALRLLPSVLLSPVAATLADRWRREIVLVVGSLVLMAAAGISAITLFADGPLALVYGLAAVATIGLTPYRAAHSALVPSLCHTTDQLAASHIVRGMLDSLSVVLGPLATSGLLALADVWAVFAATAVAGAAAGVCVLRLPYEPAPRLAPTVPRRLVDEVADGLRAARDNPDALILMSLTWVQTFLRGTLNVFVVVLAVDVLETGDAGVGLLQAAMGVGAVTGSLAAAQLVGTRHMGAWHALSVALWGLPLCVIGVRAERPIAFAMFAFIGVANAVLDVALFTMLGRLVADDVLARVFGVFETMVALSVAVGSAAAAAAVHLLGVRWALVLLGAAAPLAARLALPRLRRVDDLLGARQGELDVLQQVAMLRALPVPTIEQLARQASVRQVAPGRVVIRHGTVGAWFFVVVSGEVEVLRADQVVGRMGPGEAFGEISLLRSVRRTTTVRAGPAPVVLYAIDRASFVAAVSGYGAAARAASTVIASWSLADDGPRCSSQER